MLVSFRDGPVYSRSQSEIVGIDDEPAHASSLAGQSSHGLRMNRAAAVLKRSKLNLFCDYQQGFSGWKFDRSFRARVYSVTARFARMPLNR